MFDFSHLPENATVSEFPAIGGGTYRVWHKPPNCRLVFMLVIGSGGGGSGGVTGGSVAGGRGGGSGGITQALYLASDIPNTLYVRMPDGATGGSAGSPGGSGGGGANPSVRNTATLPASPLNVLIIASGAFGGTTSSPGTGGPAATTTDAPYLSKSIYFASAAGNSGGSSSSGSSGTDRSIGTTSPILGGCGGGGKTATLAFFGGTFSSEIPLIVPSIPQSVQGINGSQGYRLPFLFLGGCGGFSSNISNGGDGGHACAFGGGGGAGGSANTLGGSGGNGGPAYICIIAW
jgi:hypothetical protein